ncbi:MAG: Crp/Fnr family transcriptional regulator [Bacteroidales bacterium]|jgi:CRP/FNR family transcriptional regulator
MIYIFADGKSHPKLIGFSNLKQSKMNSEIAVKNCEDCPVAWQNFKTLTKSELALVNGNRYEAYFKAGEMILKQGSPASNAVFLSHGIAKIFTEGRDRKNLILEIALPSSLILAPGALFHTRNTFSVSALTNVRACFISLQVINQLASQNAEFAAGIIKDLSAKSLTVHEKLVSHTQKRMPGRLAEALLFFADVVYQSEIIDMILSRQELGELTNMAKESVVRIMRDFDLSGVITSESSKITILDMPKLRMISERG